MTETIVAQIKKIADKRGLLVNLLDNPSIGGLRLDVNQAIEELDELLEELNKTFPDKQ